MDILKIARFWSAFGLWTLMKPARPPALTSKVSPPQDDCRSVNHSHDRKRAPYNQRAFGSPGLTPTTSRITRWNFRYFEVPQVGASNVVGWSCRCRCCSSNSNVLHLQSLVWIFFFLLLLFPNLSPHQSPLSLSLSLCGPQIRATLPLIARAP